jgi:hypothetical protein
MNKDKKIKGFALMSNGGLIQLGERTGYGCQYVFAIFDSRQKAQRERRWMESEEEIVPIEIILKGRQTKKRK